MSSNMRVLRGVPEAIPLLAQLVDRVMRPYTLAGEGMAKRFPLLFQENNAHNLFYIAKQGIPVSMAAVWRGEVATSGLVIPVASIGSVATLKEFRGQGLASRILQHIWTQLMHQGVPVVQISGNRDLYHRLGAEPVGDFLRARGHIQAQAAWPVKKLTNGDSVVEELAKIYRSEAVRYERTRDDMRQLLAGLSYPRRNTRHSLFVAQQGRRLVAYAVVGVSDRWEGARTMEWAGSRSAVLSILQYAASHYGVPSVELVIGPSDYPMRKMAAAAGLVTEPTLNLGTMAVVDRSALIRTLEPWIAQRWGVEHRTADIWQQINQFAAKPGEFAQWVFSAQGMALPWPYAGGLNYV